MATAPNEFRKGITLTLICYLIWGLFPLYWYPLSGFDPLQLMAQRICWSLLFVGILLIATRQTDTLICAIKNQKILLTFMASAALLFANWTTYLWAISSHRVLDASLGYYINPLVSIFLGRLFLKEALSPQQYIAIIIAALGVLYLALLGDSFPYAALILAFTFGFYGLIKRVASLPTIPGLTLETLFMMPFAILYLLYEGSQGRLQFLSLPPLSILILTFSGVATTIPLLLFSEGAKRIPLSLIGILQYIAPTMQFIAGILIFKEAFDHHRLIGFIAVWIAVALFIHSEWRAHRARQAIKRHQQAQKEAEQKEQRA